MHHLMTGRWVENWVVRHFFPKANIPEHVHTDLDGTAHCTPGLHGAACAMGLCSTSLHCILEAIATHDKYL